MKILILAILISTQALSKSSDYIPYVIKKDDNVSTVLKNHQLAPLYGKQKWVDKVLKLNRLTETTAKKLEIGDVIVVPYKSQIMFRDDIKNIQSSIIKKIETDFISPKTYNFTLSGGYFNRNYTYKNENDNVGVNQNFFVTATYKERDPYSLSNFSFNPIGRAQFYTQANANFNSDKSKVAEFTPSALISGGIEIEHRATNIALAPIIEYEYFSALTFDGSDYSVTRNNQLWSGAELTKYFYNTIYNPYVRVSGALGSIASSSKYGASVGLNFKNHYLFQLSFNQSSMELEEQTTINDTTFTFGYTY